jgi:sterol desaturase/sphingolipid hydroxylase (fatty acid hydroxylase superfamily)
MRMMPDLVVTFETVIIGTTAAVFVFLLVIETRSPLRQAKRSKAGRLFVNAGVSVLALSTGAFIVAPVATSLSARSSEASFGLLRLLPLPFVVEVVLGFLLMDLTFYYWHRANHSFSLLWRFHNVHHVDPDLDVSTSFRFHLGEVLYSVAFRALQVTLLGVSLFTYLAYELVFQCATMFQHSNVRLPITLERVLNKVYVTPRMHGIHHSIVKDETNSNYSVVFRWWDQVHGTLMLDIKQTDIVIGVAGYSEPQHNTFLNLLALPFRKQRDYWRPPGGKQPERTLLHGCQNILAP